MHNVDPGRSPYGPPSGPPPYAQGGPYPAPAPRRGRTWLVLGCVGMVLLLLLLTVAGGIVYLAMNRGGGEPTEPPTAQRETVTGEVFTLTYGPEWEQVEIGPEAVGGVVLQLQGEASIQEGDEVVRDRVDVYHFTSSLHAESECGMQAGFLGLLWDEKTEPEKLEAATIGGKDASHHRVTGKHAGVDAVAETWCVDVDGKIVQISTEAYDTTALPPSVQEILDSWSWVEE